LTFFMVLFIGLSLLGVAGAIWGFFLFAGIGPIALLITNLVLDLGWGLLIYFLYEKGALGLAIFPFFWLGLKAFSLGLLMGLTALWIPGLVVLSIVVLFLLILLLLLTIGI